MLTAPFDIKDGDASAMQLSIPSAATLVEVSCPPARRNLGPGAVIGRLQTSLRTPSPWLAKAMGIEATSLRRWNPSSPFRTTSCR